MSLRERTRPGLGVIEPFLTSPANELWRCATPMQYARSGASNRMIKAISGGVAHELPLPDLRKVLTSDPKALAAWEDLTPLARNEWICWAISVKKPETRREHVERVCAQLKEGTRRPCCWMGCTHRTDKSLSASQKFILSKRSKK